VVARRSGLGKGLSALIPSDVTQSRQSALLDVAIGSIRPNPLQPREHFDEETMSSLAASIKELGVLQPVLVRPVGDEYELVAGERRWRAARRAGLQTIPVIVEDVDELQSLEHALVENLHRQDLNAIEEASAYQQLIEEFEYTHEEVAVRVGKSRAAVSNMLRLLQLPSSVQRLVAEGQISAGHARALLGTPDRGFQERLARQIVEEGLTVRAVEERVRVSVGADDRQVAEPPEVTAAEVGPSPGPGEVGRPSSRLPPPGIVELEELLGDFLNTRVKVDLSNKRGRVVVEFATLEDLERIYKLMVGGGGSGSTT
jgi:ParB family chromosome partitioning protein